MNTKVYIDPRCDRVFASYYIKGLCEVFGKRNVKYSLKYFKSVDMSRRIPSDDPAGGEEVRVLLFVIKKGKDIRKYAVDTTAKTYIYDAAYEWSDVFAKINFEEANLAPKYRTKILSIPPSFGISCYGKLKTVLNALYSAFICYFPKKLIYKSPYKFLRECVSNNFKRPDLSVYESDKIPVKPKYVYFISSFWPKRADSKYDHAIDLVNDNRMKYLNAVTSFTGIDFEGGVYSPNEEIFNSKGKKISYSNYLPAGDYVRKTKQSICVFNTPAVWECHGWKLGEFLAMGKAIISTPLKNALPEQLIDGENIVIVHNEQEIEKTIERLASDDAYRKCLEKGASQYYMRYCSPSSVVKYILEH